MSATGGNEAVIYQLKITLKYTQPPIWRRVLVPGDVSLFDLHRVIQVAVGWEDDHLHAFRVGGADYTPPGLEHDVLWGPRPRNEDNATLQAVAPRAKSRFSYEYDFGDSWRHEILVEKLLPPEEGKRYPVCIAGERAGPPEDSGGVSGYAMKLEVLGDPADPDYEYIAEWMGADFDPERFDLQEVNARLAQLQRPRRRGIPADAGAEANLVDALVSLKVPKALRGRAGQVMEVADGFSAEHLDMDYAYAARRVVATLARKRPSPLLEGEPRLWAAAVLHVVVAVNAVFDLSQELPPLARGEQLGELAGLPVERLWGEGEDIVSMLGLRPLDLVLPRHGELLSELMSWLMAVQAGLADPNFPPPALEDIIDRLDTLEELLAPEPRDESKARPAEERPLLRLIELPPLEPEEEGDAEEQ